jgi:hypothetical protein
MPAYGYSDGHEICFNERGGGPFFNNYTTNMTVSSLEFLDLCN